MNEQTETVVVDGVKLNIGGIYLRDKRNGRIHQYQDGLADMSYIERFEYDGTLPTKDSAGFTKLTLKGIDKAADWDRLASMSTAEREAELKRRAEYNKEQAELKEKTNEVPVEPDEYSDDSIVLLSKDGPNLKAYREQKWTDTQLIERGLAIAKVKE